MSREPARPRYDAVVDFHPPEAAPELAYGLVKLTYRIVGGRCELDDEPEPLYGDLRDPEASPRVPPGSDFWIMKPGTDVAVRGSAFGPAGRLVRERRVSVQVGAQQRSIQVFGNRVVEWRPGLLRFSDPEPFEAMPLVWSLAYGGCDPRVPHNEPETFALMQRLEYDHPGLYPRNPFGKGYVVIDDPVDGLELPNLEDPDRLLTPQNLIVGDPRVWYRQPLPACFEFTCLVMWNRVIYLGAQAWYPPAADALLEEVERGWIPENYLELRQGQIPVPLLFYREAALGLGFPDLPAGTPISVAGMHPEEEVVSFALPAAPGIVLAIDGDARSLYPAPTRLLIEPAEKRVQVTYAVKRGRETFPRLYVPGIHGRIPMSLSVGGDEPIWYETPPTRREQRLAGPAEAEPEQITARPSDAEPGPEPL